MRLDFYNHKTSTWPISVFPSPNATLRPGLGPSMVVAITYDFPSGDSLIQPTRGLLKRTTRMVPFFFLYHDDSFSMFTERKIRFKVPANRENQLPATIYQTLDIYERPCSKIRTRSRPITVYSLCNSVKWLHTIRN